MNNTPSPAKPADSDLLKKYDTTAQAAGVIRFKDKAWTIDEENGRYFAEIPGLGVFRGSTSTEVETKALAALDTLAKRWKHRHRAHLVAALAALNRKKHEAIKRDNNEARERARARSNARAAELLMLLVWMLGESHTPSRPGFH